MVYRCIALFFLLSLEGTVSVLAISPFALKDIKPAAVETVRAREPGILDEFLVRAGDEVKPGQLLGKLDNDKQSYAFNTAKLKADNKGTIEVAEGEIEEKSATVTDLAERVRRRTATEAQLNAAKGRERAARGKLEQAKLSRDLAKMDAEMAEKALERRFFRAPIAGTVIEITKQRGEKAADGEIVFTVADLTELSASIPLSKEMAGGLGPNSTFLVRQPGTNITRVARIQSISAMPHASKGEQVAKVVFQNPDTTQSLARPFELLLPDGMETVPWAKPPPKPAAEAKPAPAKK